MDLFSEIERKNRESRLPLAARMRPRTLDEFVGQEAFLGEGKLLRRMLLADRITSVLFYGPPGTGKTTLANLIARHSQSRFVELNAAACGVKEVRTVIDEARDHLAAEGKRTLLFLDEIHHFNRTQQDILLPDVENGTIVLIGATTQNPFFAINAPLVSRSQIFQFQSLNVDQIGGLLRRALADKERGLGKLEVSITDEAIEHWAVTSDGDARRALTALEIAVLSFPAGSKIVIDRQVAEDSIQRKAIVFDGTGDEHFDVASAFIKSMRGSDPDAAIYGLARMLEAGEEVRFITRRLVIFASEDIGCADPMSLVVATAAHQAAEFVGLPECQLSLAQATIHLATAPKSNSATAAIAAARKDVAEGRTVAVPDHLRDSHYQGSKRLGHGQGYKYPHDYPDADVEQTYLPLLVKYYHPSPRGHEATIRQFLADRAARHEKRERDQAHPRSEH
ncbi:MAG: replication-associated recombination protein A [Planctomycetota bacterium]